MTCLATGAQDLVQAVMSKSVSSLSPWTLNRHTLCMSCRNVLSADEACDACVAPRTVPLTTPADRRALMKEIHGTTTLVQFWVTTPSQRRLLGQLLWLMAVVMLAASILLVGMGSPLFVSIVAWSVTAVSGLLAHLSRRLPTERKGDAPAGVLENAGMPNAVGQPGLVATGRELRVPRLGTCCVGYLLVERAVRYRGGPILMRQAITEGFTLDLHDGGRVGIAPGRIRIVDCRADPIVVADMSKVPALLPVRIECSIVRVGDRVELLSSVRAVGDGPDTSWAYRDAPGVTHVAVGVAALRVLT